MSHPAMASQSTMPRGLERLVEQPRKDFTNSILEQFYDDVTDRTFRNFAKEAGSF